MNDLINNIKEYVIEKSNNYKAKASDHYDYWNEHVKYVYEESLLLADRYGANKDIVSLGALLHDIALIEEVGDRKDHHINGKILANDILDKYNCPSDIKEKVLGCVFNHRSSKNATNKEELCVCDADVLAHFDNIPMLFNSAFNRHNLSLPEAKKWIKEVFEEDYNDLSDETKELFKDKYKTIKEIILNEKEN